jgi:hypothetical protein
MLANADEHAHAGHLRSAIVEAVAALEQVVKSLPQDPGAIERCEQVADGRILTESFGAARKKLGVENSLRILVPLLFDEQDVPVELIGRCLEACELRNQVVHNQSIPGSESAVWNLITDVRKMCDFLRGNPPRSPGGWSELRPYPGGTS